jgi:hypothetical protein
MASHPRVVTSGGSHGRRPRTPLLVAGAIALAAVVIAASVLAGVYIGSPRSTPAPTATTAHTATAAPTATPQPTAKPAPTPLAGFVTGRFTAGTVLSGQLTSVGSVRAAAQTGYDRFVIDLGSSPLQQYEVRTQPTSKFTLDPKGEVVTLNGTRGVLIILYDATNHDSFAGQTDLETSLPTVKEARLVGDFEGMVSWGLGVNGPGFVRVMTLPSPNRLVVDVQT